MKYNLLIEVLIEIKYKNYFILVTDITCKHNHRCHYANQMTDIVCSKMTS